MRETSTGRKARPVKLGTKRVCVNCDTKFYDFEKEKALCPNCKSVVDINPVSKPRLSIVSDPPKKAPTHHRSSEFVDQAHLEPGLAGDPFEDIGELEDDEPIVKDIDIDGQDDSDF